MNSISSIGVGYGRGKVAIKGRERKVEQKDNDTCLQKLEVVLQLVHCRYLSVSIGLMLSNSRGPTLESTMATC